MSRIVFVHVPGGGLDHVIQGRGLVLLVQGVGVSGYVQVRQLVHKQVAEQVAEGSADVLAKVVVEGGWS